MNKTQVKTYMWNNYEDHIDYTCNVLNATGLAEDACEAFSAYLPDTDYEVPEEFYDWAWEVEQVLIKRGTCNF